MNNILKKIIEHKKEVVKRHKKEFTFFGEFQNQAIDMPVINSFLELLEAKKNTNKVSLIAEVKKASPSKGVIRVDFHPVEIAKAYQSAGASAISVLTDEKFFQGSIHYLEKIKPEVKIPVLRKDFIIDEFQIYQTRLIGADMILLILSALEKEQFKDFYKISKEVGLDVLVEVHNQNEMQLALDVGARIIGINNRNLDTFETTLDTTVNLISDLSDSEKENRFFIGESGIFTTNDVEKLQKSGVSGVLVGESLMRQENIQNAVQELIGKYL